MTSAFNITTFGILYAFLLTAAINFVLPITILLAILIFALTIASAYVSLVYIPLASFVLPARKQPHKILLLAVLAGFATWALFVARMPTTVIDANVYHLPLSLLMNQSIWYPGIGKLSSHFGFPNGTSVLGSLFTCFGSVGAENIPNVVIWAVFGMGTFLYTRRHIADSMLAITVVLLFLFTPRMFLESYNMGTDLPAACFLALGLLALSDKKLDDASLLLSLAAIFKTLGVLAAGLVLPYAIVVYVWSRKEPALSSAKIVIAMVVLLMSFTRVYIATGNPVYPSWPLNAAPWGISEEIQRGLIHGTSAADLGLTGGGLRNYSGVERSVSGMIEFSKNFLFFPHAVKSEYWFSPFLLACLFICLYRVLTGQLHVDADFTSFYSWLVVGILCAAWFYYSPLFRFIAGVLVFLNLSALVAAMRDNRSYWTKTIVHGASIGTLILFLGNAVNRLTEEIIPLANASAQNVERFMPWKRRATATDTEFSTSRTEDGFVYSKSNSNYCHRLKPPCINGRSLGDEQELIDEFRRYNKV